MTPLSHGSPNARPLDHSHAEASGRSLPSHRPVRRLALRQQGTAPRGGPEYVAKRNDPSRGPIGAFCAGSSADRTAAY